MSVLDAYAVVAFLAGEPAAEPVERLLRDRDDPPTISAMSLAEVFDVLVRVYGHAPDAVGQKVEWLLASPVAIVDADDAVARVAGRLRSEHYRKKGSALSLADCFALATASLLGVALATADPALAAAARKEGVQVIGLPDSTGRLPSRRKA